MTTRPAQRTKRRGIRAGDDAVFVCCKRLVWKDDPLFVPPLYRLRFVRHFLTTETQRRGAAKERRGTIESRAAAAEKLSGKSEKSGEIAALPTDVAAFAVFGDQEREPDIFNAEEAEFGLKRKDAKMRRRKAAEWRLAASFVRG